MEEKSSLKLFIIEENDRNARMFEAYLKNSRFSNYHFFSTSTDCLDSLTLQPDVIFLDYNLSIVDGLETLKKVKRFDPDIFVVFLSDQQEITVAVSALKYGAFDYLVKGFADAQQVRNVLGRIELVKRMIDANKKRSALRTIISATGVFSLLIFFQKILPKA